MRGSMRKRGENSWQFRVYKGIDPDTGKKDYYEETFRGTKPEAEKRLNAIVSQFDEDEFVEPSKMTFYEFLHDRWLPSVKVEVSEGTYDEYLCIVDKHIKPDRIAKLPLTKVELQHIDDYKIRKLNSPRLDGKPGTLSPKTVKNHLIAIKAAMVYACGLRILKYNPAQYVKFPRQKKKDMQTFTEDEAMCFLEGAKDDRFYLLFILAIYYGKRRGEIRGIRKRDVDTKALTISIQQSVRKSGYTAEFKDTKTDESRKVLQMEPWMAPMFEKEMTKRSAEKLEYGPGYSDNDLLFASFNGNPVKERILSDHYKSIIKKAGLPEIRFHDLRHSCATILLKYGTNPKLVQERLGHSSIKTTMDTYSHVTPTMQKDINEKMNTILRLEKAK